MLPPLAYPLDAATPRPWFLHDFTEAVEPPATCGDVTVSCDHPATITVASMGNGLTATLDEARANAALIVRAVNAYDELVAALKDIIDCYGVGSTPEKFCEHVREFMERGRAAITKARQP